MLLQPGAEPAGARRPHRARRPRGVRRARSRASDVAAAVLQTANGEVGTRQPVAAVARACAASTACRCSSTRRRPSARPGTAPAGAGSVVVADAAAFGGPPLGLLAVRTGTRWGLPGPRREAEHGREHAAPWVPLVLAAAEAWQQTAGGHGAEERAGPRPRRPGAAGRGRACPTSRSSATPTTGSPTS